MRRRQPGIVFTLLRRFQRQVAFTLIGLLNAAIDFLIFTVFLLVFRCPAVVSQVFGYCAGTLNSFLVNRKITFRSRGGMLRQQMTRYIVSCTVALLLSSLLLSLFHTFFSLDAYFSKVLAMFLVFLFNYFCMNRFVFPVSQ